MRKIREACPNHVILAGNVVTGEMVEELILSGADIVKVGIGPGSVCTTRVKTGVGYPQLSAIIECADAAHGLGGQIVGDGGCTCPGDVAKAFGGGADFVMLGGMLAAHEECGGEIVDVDGEPFMKFYGMSSSSAMDKHAGGVAEYRASRKNRTAALPRPGRERRARHSGRRALHLYLRGCQPAERTHQAHYLYSGTRAREQRLRQRVTCRSDRHALTVRSQSTGVLPCAPVFLHLGSRAMTTPLPPFDWDIFCCVVDNFGDIGVTWRLARQLKREGNIAAHGDEVQVRLWVDDLTSFARICPKLDPAQDGQWVDGIYIQHWHETLPSVMTPAKVVIEAFACELPAPS